MVDIGSRIKARRERLGWSVVKVATLAGLSASFVSRVERGKSYYSRETLMKISGALGISVDTLYASGNKSNVEDAHLGWRRIPVLNYVQAGQWTSVDGNPKDEEVAETIMTDLEHPPSTFAMRIKDDSMEPEFNAGDVVVIDPTIQPQPGDFVAASDESGEATFKQYRRGGVNEAGVAWFELHALNPAHGFMRSDRQHIAIIGVMVEKRSYRKR
jgi:SOS-response transcriptional repressor LexA